MHRWKHKSKRGIFPCEKYSSISGVTCVIVNSCKREDRVWQGFSLFLGETPFSQE